MKRFSALALAAAVLVALFGNPIFAQSPASAAPAEGAALPQAYNGASAACRAAVLRAIALSAQGKWKSAFQVLDDFDKANADPFALAMKTRLVLEGAVRTQMDRSFALADLEEGQDLETLRGGGGDYVPFAFDPPALAEAQAGKGVAPPGILSKELGDYYYDVIGRFSGAWSISDEEILAKSADQYAKAYALGVFDGPSLVDHAEALVRLSRGEEADPLFRQAIALDPKNPSLHYSYALSLRYLGKKPEAIAEADKAIEAYGEDPARMDAIALGARTAADLGDTAKTESYYALTEKYYPRSPTSGILRQLIAVESGDKAGADAAADSLIPLYGANPNVVRAIVSTWYSAGEPEAARDFLKRNIAKVSDDKTVGTLDFYLAVLLSQGSSTAADRADALKALDAAESHFKTALDPANEVFGAIEDLRKALQPPKAE